MQINIINATKTKYMLPIHIYRSIDSPSSVVNTFWLKKIDPYILEQDEIPLIKGEKFLFQKLEDVAKSAGQAIANVKDLR